MRNIKVLIVDDMELVRLGLEHIINKIEGIKCVGTAEDGRKALEFLAQHEVDLVLMDVAMKGMDGIQATRLIKENYPGVAVIGLSSYDHNIYLKGMLAAGARGYVLKNISIEELNEVIHHVIEGRIYFKNTLYNNIAEVFSECLKNGGAHLDIQDYITPQENRVLKLIAENKTNKEIADRLYISTRTVETHKRNLIKKLQLANVNELYEFVGHNRKVILSKPLKQ